MKVDGSKVRIALVAAVIGVLLGAYIGFSASPSTTQMIGGGIYPGAPSYTIWKEGSNYFAKNSNGELEFSGTNATQLMENVVSEAPVGATIFVKAGSYNIKGLDITKELTIEGEHASVTGGKGTEFYSSSGTILTITANNVVLRNLRINGYGAADIGIQIDGLHAYLENVRVVSFPTGTGIKISGYLAYFLNVRIVNCLYGIHLYAGTTNPNNLILSGGAITTNVENARLIFLDSGDTLTVYGTDFESSAANVTAIYVDYVNSRMRLLGARFETLENGIEWVAGKGTEDMILACFFSSVNNTVVNIPSTSVIKHCKGFDTENSGTATISASTSVTFNHGLAGTPTLVLCSFNSTGYGDWTWSATSTQITITVTNSGTYEVYWYAEYKP